MIIPSKTGITFLAGSVTGAIVAVALSLIAFSTWNALIDNPRVIADARKDYVQSSEMISMQTKLSLEETRRRTAEALSGQYKKNLAEAIAKNEADQAFQDQEIANYEEKLKSQNRRCDLNGDDVEWLRKP